MREERGWTRDGGGGAWLSLSTTHPRHRPVTLFNCVVLATQLVFIPTPTSTEKEGSFPLCATGTCAKIVLVNPKSIYQNFTFPQFRWGCLFMYAISILERFKVCLSVWSVRSGPSVPIEFPRTCIRVNPRNCTYEFPRRCFSVNPRKCSSSVKGGSYMYPF